MPNKWSPQIKELPFKNDKGTKVVRQRYTGKFTREEIQNYAQKQSDEFKKKGYKWDMQITIKYPEKQYPGGFTDLGDKVKIFSYDLYDADEKDPETYPEFTIYYYKNK